MDNQRKKINTGKIGFVLSLALLAISILLFIPPIFMVFIYVTLLMPYVLLCPLILLILFFLVHGLIKKRSRILATAGSCIILTAIILLFSTLITLAPPGSMPYPLNIYKFKRACPKAAFWLDFDRGHIEQVQSQNVFFENIGTVQFITSSNTYTTQQIVQYAKANGWKHHASIPESIFQAFLDADEGDLYDFSGDDLFFWYEIKSIYPLNFLIERNDTILIFETENYLGVASFAVLSGNKDSLRIYYNNPARPDPSKDFSLPESFQKFNDPNNEEIHENQRHRTSD